MCVLENELENQLGEFHIKMKGKNVTSIHFSSVSSLFPLMLPLSSLRLLANAHWVSCSALEQQEKMLLSSIVSQMPKQTWQLLNTVVLKVDICSF